MIDNSAPVAHVNGDAFPKILGKLLYQIAGIDVLLIFLQAKLNFPPKSAGFPSKELTN